MKKTIFFAGLMVWLASCQNTMKTESMPAHAAPQNLYYVGEAAAGNAGHGKFKNGKVYLVDLAEMGIEGDDEPVSEWRAKLGDFIAVRKRVKAALITDELPIDEVTERITSIAMRDPLLANTLIEALSLYSWNVVDERFLLLPLEGEIIEHKEGDLVLIANRRGKEVKISRPILKLMNKTHRGALILHEIISPLLPPKEVQLANGGVVFEQDTARILEVTGTFYTDKYYKLSSGDTLAAFLSKGELPFLEALPPNEFYHNSISSTFLASEPEAKRNASLPTGVAGIIGPVHLEFKTSNRTFNFDYDDSEMDVEGRLNDVCYFWSGKLQMNLVFEGKEPNQGLYQLKFSTYNNGTADKVYLKHERTTGRHVVPYKTVEAGNGASWKIECLKQVNTLLADAYTDVLATEGFRVQRSRYDREEKEKNKEMWEYFELAKLRGILIYSRDTAATEEERQNWQKDIEIIDRKMKEVYANIPQKK